MLNPKIALVSGDLDERVRQDAAVDILSIDLIRA
jgi:hypothetical protein